jgi:hypothetical protein
VTPLKKPVRRETPAFVKNRALVIELHPWGIRIREKGLRHSYDVTYRQVYEVGAKNKANETRQEKLNAKKAKKKNG